MGWRTRMVVAPLVGLIAATASFAIVGFAVLLIAMQADLFGMCFAVQDDWRRFVLAAMSTAPPVLSLMAGFATFRSIVSAVSRE